MLSNKFQFIWESGFRGEDFLEINQSETRMACGGHVCSNYIFLVMAAGVVGHNSQRGPYIYILSIYFFVTSLSVSLHNIYIRALDVRLSEWCCSVTMVWVQIPSREEQKFDRSSGTDILYGCHLLLDVCIIYFISCDCIVKFFIILSNILVEVEWSRALGKAKRIAECNNGVGSNPVEGRTKI